MTDQLRTLPRLSWRGIILPVTSRSARFGQRKVGHEFPYRNGRILEGLGADNFGFDYGIPMREDLAKGPYRNLFTETLPRFLAACRDRSPGPLVDPLYGEFRAECISYEDTIDVNKRDGTDLRVSFEHSPKLDDLTPELALEATIPGATVEAGALDAEIAKISQAQLFAAGLTEIPSAGTDILASISGFGRQLVNAGNRIAAKLDRVALQLEAVEGTLEILEDPTQSPLIRSSRRLRDTVHRLKTEHQNPGRRILKSVQQASRAMSAVAADVGMTPEELMSLNPTLDPVAMVPAQFEIKYFADSV